MAHPFNPRLQGGDGIRIDPRKDKEAELAERYQRRRLMRRLIQDGERRYTAYSAEEILELDGLAHYGRPGLPY